MLPFLFISLTILLLSIGAVYFAVFDSEYDFIDELRGYGSKLQEKISFFEFGKAEESQILTDTRKYEEEKHNRRRSETARREKDHTTEKEDLLESKDYLVAVGHLHKSHCFTLEQYSETFLDEAMLLHLSGKKKASSEGSNHFFRCGVRVSDLRLLALEGFEKPKEQETIFNLCRANGKDVKTNYPDFRILLTEKEKKWHLDRKGNIALQAFPLSHFNDDYCDCFDGTDELSTSACSMVSEGGILLSGARLKPYHDATKNAPLYEDMHESTMVGKKRVSRPLLFAHKSGVSGPVLPFRCGGHTNGDVQHSALYLSASLIAPSMVGDGIIDCSDGSDETEAILSERLLQNVHPSQRAKVEAAVKRIHEQEVKEWKERKERVQAYLLGKYATKDMTLADLAARGVPAGKANPYKDPLHPHHTSPIAVLVEKGFQTLFDADVVRQQQIASLKVLTNIYEKGHATQQERCANGWSSFGADLARNYTELQNRFRQVYREYVDITEYLQGMIDESPSGTLEKSGVTKEEYNQYLRLHFAKEQLEQSMQLLSAVFDYKSLGEHFEYAALVLHPVRLPAEEVVDGRRGLQLDSSTVMTVSDMMEAAQERRSAPDFHMDNYSFFGFSLTPGQTFTGAQRYEPEEEEMVLRALRLLKPEENYTVGEADKYEKDIYRRSPPISIGHWQPHLTQKHAVAMTLTDPAGDTDIARRAGVLPTSWLHRGGGRLQWPARVWEEVFQQVKTRAESKNKTEDLKHAAAGQLKEEVNEQHVTVMFNTPHSIATHIYSVGPTCGPSVPATAYYRNLIQKEESELSEDDRRYLHFQRRMLTHVNYVCDEKDSVLSLARNGACAFELVVGTPSACTAWALKQFKERLSELEKV
ncbi:hypothetical protein AGDE_11255 [Angomonas deanei]|uniref:Uncharacterized protein n=1 Tax=Angomonas deanei TaxID=59799 RepID=A0A7G2CL17_9TRYP|nr:hypothetical protein AGDE_11255 [Angomonas deanei]CAD2219263.1 hypothetical protein, conserved [Angomonas deanei]|eukprot:EPY26506.1 hypothetical protein AGDE_11255 [Angomonas deanei]